MLFPAVHIELRPEAAYSLSWCILRENANSINGTLRAMVYTDGAGLDIVNQRCRSRDQTRSQRGYG